MDTLLKVQMQIVPDLLLVMQKRYEILRSISVMEPVGRRTLANVLGLTERTLRSEVDFLKKQQLIDIQTSGMSITEKGYMLMYQLEETMRYILGINLLESKLTELLQIQEVVIVQGDSDSNSLVKNEIGKACAERMKRELEKDNIIAVAGGTTMASTAEMLTPGLSNEKSLLFVPARGGLGEEVYNQANVICAKMAERTGGSHSVLYAPDQIGREAYESLMKEPSIKENLRLLKSANIVLHGIGDAIIMAKRRGTSAENMQKIKAQKAVGEAFGYYFNEEGEIVHKVPTIGIQMAELSSGGRKVIAAAGGKSKAKAIMAYMKSAPKTTILITDEGAAKAILEGITF